MTLNESTGAGSMSGQDRERRSVSLARLFADLNRRYWRSRLPRYRVIRRATLRGNQGLLGSCDTKTRTILLRRDLSPEELRLTLLHEMCHITAGPGHPHGRRFLRKVRRLIRLGESRLLEEVERYDGGRVRAFIAARKAEGRPVQEISFQSALASDIEAIALEFPRKRWATGAAVLAAQHHTTAAGLRRAAPGAERQWRQAAAEMRYHQRVAKAWEDGRMPPRPPRVAARRGTR